VAIELDKMESLMGATICDCGRSPTPLPRDGVAVYPEAQPFRFLCNEDDSQHLTRRALQVPHAELGWPGLTIGRLNRKENGTNQN
jgi:hypothetical protein